MVTKWQACRQERLYPWANDCGTACLIGSSERLATRSLVSKLAEKLTVSLHSNHISEISSFKLRVFRIVHIPLIFPRILWELHNTIPLFVLIAAIFE